MHTHTHTHTHTYIYIYIYIYNEDDNKLIFSLRKVVIFWQVLAR